MSWLTRIIPSISSRTTTSEPKKKSPIPAGLWMKCPSCDQVLYKEELEESLRVCPKCGFHMRLGARDRLQAFLDWKGTHEEIGADVRPVDTLGFVDSQRYPERNRCAAGDARRAAPPARGGRGL